MPWPNVFDVARIFVFLEIGISSSFLLYRGPAEAPRSSRVDMSLIGLLCLVLPCFWIEGALAASLFLERNANAAAPDCSLSCLSNYIPQYCGSASNTTCICTSADLTNVVSSCAYAACSTIPELLQLQRYSAVSCGVESDKTRLQDVLRMDYIVPFLTACFIGGRIVARVLLDVGLGADDWMILAAAVAYFVDVGTSLGLVLNGFGQHTYWLSTEQVTNGRKFFYVVELFYIISITLTKLALLLFFLRIFPDHRLRQLIWICGLFVFLSNFSILMALGFQCMPLHAYWTNWMYKVPPIQCINSYGALEAAAVFSIVQSVMILIVPIPTVWKLKLAWKKKANLMIMFSVGFVALVCSFMRLPSLVRLDQSSDLSYDQAPVVVYSHLEQSVGIICACLPACRSLLEYFFPSLKMTFRETNVIGASARSNRIPSTLPKSRVEQNSSTRSLVKLSERQAGIENGSERLSTRTLSFHNDIGSRNSGVEDLGTHATAETGPNVGATVGTDSYGIYLTKSVDMVTDKRE
ncbi:hypothetical protein BKA64DRAFT_15732 [Cadophora sp. MPI-SDFR-AT-0126]|nr:hypothetical protein BKA64DRAFT_15732 [Leotiomycetes sp. MPI-SDFR-AT-0126]